MLAGKRQGPSQVLGDKFKERPDSLGGQLESEQCCDSANQCERLT